MDSRKSPLLSALQALLDKAQQSTSNTLESIFEKTQMDCRENSCGLSRNDNNTATSKKMDSSDKAQNDSKYCGGALRVWRSAKSRAKPLLQTTYNATLSVLDKCAHRLRKPFIADKEGYCKHCGYRLYKPQWLQELEAKHTTTQVKAKPKTKGQK